MFRAVSLPIVRSFPLYIRHWYMSCRFHDNFQARPGWSCTIYIYTHTQWVYWALSLPIRRPGCESEHTLPSSAEVKFMRRNAPILLCIFTSRCGMTHTENFILFIFIYVYERNTVNLKVSLLFIG